MNTAHWHLLLNHVPVIGSVIGMGILIAGFIFRNHPLIKKTSLGVFIFSALLAIPAYLTGEGAEDAVEKMPDVTKSLIHDHEELGEVFFIIVAVLGVLALLAFFADWKKHKATPLLYVIVFLGSIGACVLGTQTANSGGKVRHTEIRSADQQQLNPTEQQGQGEEEGEKDKD